jgi:hypothetical protein
MNFEEMQSAWKSQGSGEKMMIDADVLLKEVRRNQRNFRATIFWRDVREVGAALLLTVFFAYRGLRNDAWTDGAVALACFWIGLFMIMDRVMQRRKQPASNDSLKACAEGSLFAVKHQIWLLKNVFWWYLLPLAAALAISKAVSIWHSREIHSALTGGCIYVLVVVLLYRGIYRLNQWAVRKSLEPRRQELETLLASLK